MKSRLYTSLIVVVTLASCLAQMDEKTIKGFIYIDLDTIQKVNPIFCRTPSCDYNISVCLRPLKVLGKNVGHVESDGFQYGFRRKLVKYFEKQNSWKKGQTLEFTFSDKLPTEVQMEISYTNTQNNETYTLTNEFPLYQSLENIKQSFYMNPIGHDALQILGSIMRKCNQDHYGENCERFCKENYDIDQHYRCKKNGLKICKNGWSGENCDRANCLLGCSEQNGYCDIPNTCKCKYGWKGEFCNECEKYPNCKNGYCLESPFTCVCYPNWTGKFCDIPIKYCKYHNKCQNNGICRENIENNPGLLRQLKNSTFQQLPSTISRCICPDGYKGEFCEKRMEVCEKDPCLHGKCITTNELNGQVSYTCNCEPGWEGVHCERIRQLCSEDTCKNAGHCHSIDGLRVQCLCPSGFIGDLCQVRNNCSLLSGCKYAESCNGHESNSQQCNCLQGWSGKFCDNHIDQCLDNPCQNNGKCIDLGNTYSCECRIGYHGKNCEKMTGCLGVFCLNGGICKTDMNKRPYCECTSAFMGDRCETLITKCKPNPCQNNSTCYDISNQIFCKCQNGYSGQLCSSFILNTDPLVHYNENPCQRTNCSGNGFCQYNNEKNIYECSCRVGWSGDACQERVDTCQNGPCKNDGICHHTSDGTVSCVCRSGFTGTFCDERIPIFQSKYICKNNGTYDENNEYCICNGNDFGVWCELNPSSIATKYTNMDQSLCDIYGDDACLNGGTCSRDNENPFSYRCICEQPFHGRYCHKRIPHNKVNCSEHNMCKNGGKCVNLADNFFCQCRPGFEGRYCEEKIDSCLMNPCKNQGKCISINGYYQCSCLAGFQGLDCSINVNECENNQCSYGSKCIDLINKYECLCPKGRTGRYCDEVISPDFINHPSCLQNNQTFDHQEIWHRNCHECSCNLGKVECKTKTCVIPSCLNAEEEGYPEFACKQNEVCEQEDFPVGNKCLIEPCYRRFTCIKINTFQVNTFIQRQRIGKMRNCLPHDYVISGHCVTLKLTLNKMHLPYGIYSNDICNAIERFLPRINSVKNFSSIIINCGVSEINDFQFIINFALEEEEIKEISDVKSNQINLALNETKLLLRQTFNQNLEQLISSSETFQGKHAEQRKYLLNSLTKIKNPKTDVLLHTIIAKAIVKIEYEPYRISSKNDVDDINALLIPLIFISTLIIALLLAVFIWAYAKRKRNELIANYLKVIGDNTDGFKRI